jgi:hypothetical protein
VFGDDDEKEWMPLDDRIWGIQGTYHGKRKAKGYDSDEDLYYVRYIPDIVFGHWLRKWLWILNPLTNKEDLIEETPDPIPESMIPDQKTPSSEAEGVPKYTKLLLRDKDGKQPYETRVGKEIGKDLQAETERRKEAEGEALREKVRNPKKHRDSNGSTNGSGDTLGL